MTKPTDVAPHRHPGMRQADALVRLNRTLGAGRFVLREYLLEYVNGDGTVRTLRREACHRPDSVAILPYSQRRGTIILVRQPRLPVMLSDERGRAFLEVPGGVIGNEQPDVAARRELAEETGYQGAVTLVQAAFMSPATLTERVYLFLADIDAATRTPMRCAADEPINTIEIPVRRAKAMLNSGEIVDGRTILLLTHARTRKELP